MFIWLYKYIYIHMYVQYTTLVGKKKNKQYRKMHHFPTGWWIKRAVIQVMIHGIPQPALCFFSKTTISTCVEYLQTWLNIWCIPFHSLVNHQFTHSLVAICWGRILHFQPEEASHSGRTPRTRSHGTGLGRCCLGLRSAERVQLCAIMCNWE